MQDFGKRDRELFIRTYFTHVFGRNAETAFDVYREQICPSGPPASEMARYLASDVLSRVPSVRLAENLARRGRQVFVYEWDYESSGSQGLIKASHMMDAGIILSTGPGTRSSGLVIPRRGSGWRSRSAGRSWDSPRQGTRITRGCRSGRCTT
ncbi:hypothetical protein BC936DRAFT_136652 [Jimgerdemannia flammicorona]|uniref:Uncharacterized protein n=1 Tax=Jimgerdemannia flammicorona TaxID=994334 RepID=A0A433DJM7_9FUNG|nr:hypothetical protein BC936DRAFT_136652 [Jimgerdemannia flammicorona]